MSSTFARGIRAPLRLAVAALPPVVVAVVAWSVTQLLPIVSALMVALVVGALVANHSIRDHAWLAGHEHVTKVMLRLGVVFLGLRLPLGDIADLGMRGIAVIVVTATLTFVGTTWIGDRLRLERGLVTLVAAGFSICGAAAIAAVEGGIKRRTEDIALAIAMVTIFGSAMIVFVPFAGDALGLSELQQGVWAGASIHEVAQVVAAATAVGAGAVAIATTIKLGRVSLLAVAYAAARRRDGTTESSAPVPTVPWFVIGFFGAALLRTADILPNSVLTVADILTTLLLAAAMFGLGLGLNLSALLPVPRRVFVLAASSTLIALGVSLGLILTLF